MNLFVQVNSLLLNEAFELYITRLQLLRSPNSINIAETLLDVCI